MKYSIENKNLLILFTSTFLFFLNEALLLPTLPVHLSSIGYTNTQIGIVLGAFALGVLLFRPLSGYVTDQKSRKLALIIGALFGSGSALCSPALSAFVADETQQQARGTVFGFYYGAFDTGVIVAGLIMGVIADLTTLRDMFVILSLSGLVCLLVFVMVIRNTISGSIKWSLAGK